ncbi:MAG TPA: TIGR02678 family protein [Thermoleophilaceae bacterium]|nr:TIGR02678 family protein [Thermoleophilaceae bacterium]
MTALADALAATRTEEIRRAARALLGRPLLRATGPDAEDFTLVRRHAAELREWFSRNTGWRLVADPEVARLLKTAPATDDPTYPARDVKSKSPFTRRRYVLACLALAVLERADAQITLGRLAEQVVLAAADPELVEAGVSFGLTHRDERTDLVAVVRLLLDLGVLARVAGDEDAYVKDTEDALYDVQRRVLVTLLATRRGPSTITATAFADQLRALTADLTPDTEDTRNQAMRHELTRRISELTGLVPEVRAEGIAMVDPADDLTDIRRPRSARTATPPCCSPSTSPPGPDPRRWTSCMAPCAASPPSTAPTGAMPPPSRAPRWSSQPGRWTGSRRCG